MKSQQEAMNVSQDSWASEDKTVSKRIEDSDVKQKYDFYQKPEVIPQDEKRSMQASFVGSIRSLESRNREDAKHDVNPQKITNLVNDLSDIKGDSSLSMLTESPREDPDYDYKRATMNATQSSYSQKA